MEGNNAVHPGDAVKSFQVRELHSAIRKAFGAVTPKDVESWFASCGAFIKGPAGRSAGSLCKLLFDWHRLGDWHRLPSTGVIRRGAPLTGAGGRRDQPRSVDAASRRVCSAARRRSHAAL